MAMSEANALRAREVEFQADFLNFGASFLKVKTGLKYGGLYSIVSIVSLCGVILTSEMIMNGPEMVIEDLTGLTLEGKPINHIVSPLGFFVEHLNAISLGRAAIEVGVFVGLSYGLSWIAGQRMGRAEILRNSTT